MAATIKDLARETGLGCATISAYLNGANVRPKNKELIEAAVKKLGYVRNEYARGLKMHRSMTVGVLIPELSNAFSTTIISEMEDGLRSRGYGILVCDCRSNLELEKQALQFLQSKMVDGVIVMPMSTDGKIFDALPEKTPAVVIDRFTLSERVSHVLINNREISAHAVRTLTGKGHRRIALISGECGLYTADERRKGYEEAMRIAGCYDESLIYGGNFTVDGGYLAMKEIIQSGRDITAVFVTNYEMTIGAIIAINEMRRKIPQDYSFIGFDNHDLSKVITPQLAAVSQPLRDIGREAAAQLLREMDGGEKRDIILPATLELGESIREI